MEHESSILYGPVNALYRPFDTVAHVVRAHPVVSEQTLTVADVLAADAWARDEAARLIERAR